MPEEDLPPHIPHSGPDEPPRTVEQQLIDEGSSPTQTVDDSGPPAVQLSNIGGPPSDPMIGQTVGKIRIQGILGAGGMGQVFAGFDEKLKRAVALKSIRRQHAQNHEMKARFLQEAQILSRLQHPNICQIYDFIESEDNGPNAADYLVLELIEGKTLKELSSADLDEGQKLAIALELAEVLAAAHDAGVVHRDLKPANVMLTEEGHAKVLDFGIAQSIIDEEVASFWRPATEAQGPHQTRTQNQAGSQISSEMEVADTVVLKAEGVSTAAGPDAEDADDSTRVLGETTRPADYRFRTQTGSVVGTPQSMSPEQARGERAGSASDMYSLGLLLHELFTGNPAYPSSLSMLQLLDAVQNGRTEPVHGLSPDLTTLIERLCSAAPGSRPSARDTAERLRWIQRAPARRRRRRLQYAGVAALFAVAIAMSFQAFRIDQEATRAQLAAEQAEQEARTTRQVLNYFLSLFQAADPWQASQEQEQGEDLTVGEVLERGMKRLEQDLQNEPRIRARVLASVGEAQLSLGRFEAARPLFEQSKELHSELPEISPDLVGVLTHLAIVSKSSGDLQTAEMQLREALDHYQELDQTTASSDPVLAQVGQTHFQLGTLYAEQGRFEEAEPALRRSLAVFQSQDDPDRDLIAKVRMEMATVREQFGDFATAEDLLREILSSAKSRLGTHNPQVAEIYNRLGIVLDQQDKVEEAIEAYSAGIDVANVSLGDEHYLPATIAMNLGSAYRKALHYSEAEEQYRKSRPVLERLLGPDHPRVGELYGNWGTLQLEVGDYEAARISLKRAEAIFRGTFGEVHPSVALCLGILSNIDRWQRRWPEAEEGLSRSIVLLEQVFGDDHPSVGHSRAKLARLFMQQGRLERSQEILDALPVIREPDSAQTPLDGDAQLFKADLERRSGRLQEARVWLERARPLMTNSKSSEVLRESLFLRIEGNLNQAEGHLDKALESYRASRAKGEKVRPSNHPGWIDLLEDEASVLESLGKMDEAKLKRSRVKVLAARHRVEMAAAGSG